MMLKYLCKSESVVVNDCEKNRELRCVILGGGGHARVLIDSMQASRLATPYAILDSDRSRWGQKLQGIPILGNDDLLPELINKGVNCFAVGVGSTSDNRLRQRLFELSLSCNLKPLTVIHPTATCSQWAKIGLGSQLFPGSVVNAGVTLGANVIVNSGAIIEHDCQLDDHVHVATGARLCSTVCISSGVHVGAGATVKQFVTVGEGAVVGAGAVVLKDVAAFKVVVGVPACFLRDVKK